MGAKIVCDGCGKEKEMFTDKFGFWVEPRTWFLQRDGKVKKVACSRKCFDKVMGKHAKV